MIVLKDTKRLKDIVLSNSDYGLTARALRDPAFDWGFLPEILASDNLDITLFDALSLLSNRWVIDGVDWGSLLVRLEQLYATSSDLEKRMFYNSFHALLSGAIITEFVKEEDLLILPEFFIVGFYDFLTPGDWEGASYWLYLIDYPGLSDEFKKKVWLEHRDSIVEQFTIFQNGNLHKNLNWNNVPSFMLFNLISFIDVDRVVDTVQFFREVALEAWRVGLVEGLQGSYPELSFEGLPFDWVEEFYLSTVNVTAG